MSDPAGGGRSHDSSVAGVQPEQSVSSGGLAVSARWRTRARAPRWLVPAVKTVIGAVVVWGVGRHVARVWSNLEGHDFALAVNPARLVSSGLLYLAGLSCCGAFYASILRASPTPIGLGPALRAYLVSHLGKYVPGKAMVVVMRAGMSVPFGARATTAAIATFYETLVMMASGSVVAAVVFAQAGDSPPIRMPMLGGGTVEVPVDRAAVLLALGLAACFLTIVAPPVFRRLARLVADPIAGAEAEVVPRLSPGLLVRGLIGTTAGWVLMGLSQLEAACAFSPAPSSRVVELLPIAVASVALATVAGFAVPVLPGGLGVREGVLMYTLGPALGDRLAVAAALALRLVWIAAELLAAAFLVPLGVWMRGGSGGPERSGARPQS